MLANDLRKGMVVFMRDGTRATIADNAKGNIRMAKVEGFVTEIGSVYVKDMAYVELLGGATEPVVLSLKQANDAARIKAAGF
jgi:hypothetical protein